MPTTLDLSVEILEQIRDELVTTRTDVGARIDHLGRRIDELGTSLGARIDETNARVGAVETTLLELAEQQRFMVRHLSVLAPRDRGIESEVDELRARVDAIEKQIASG